MKKYFEQAHEDIARHALEEWPRQMCGVVVEEGSGFTYQRLFNKSDDCHHGFAFDEEELVKAGGRGKIAAIVHSHCDFPHATRSDMERQASLGIPFGIAFVRNRRVRDICFFGDELPIQDYVGRPFYHGIHDCYGLLRDYHREEYGITLKQYPRDFKWWQTDEGLLFDHIQDAGFRMLDKRCDDIAAGDCILARVFSRHVNHCGICVGEGQLLHHLCLRASSLSSIEPVAGFDARVVTHIARHKDL